MIGLGQKVYAIKRYGHPSYIYEVYERTVTSIHLEDEQYSLDNSNHRVSISPKGDGNALMDFGRIYTSKKKAENVAKSLNDEQQRQEEKQKKINEKAEKIAEYNKKWIETLDVIGKEVMVYIGKGEWVKQTIKKIVGWNKLETWAFWGYRGYYLSTREGKNWYFWTELDELKRKKKDIEDKIKALVVRMYDSC